MPGVKKATSVSVAQCGLRDPVIRNVFRIVTDFKKHWQECYVPKLTVAENASPNPLPSFDWIQINYQF